MQHVHHHNRLQRAAANREPLGIHHAVHAGREENFRGDSLGAEGFQEPRARPEFEHRPVCVRQPLNDQPVPIVVDAAQEGLLLDDATPQSRGLGVVDVPSIRKRMGEQPFHPGTHA